MPHHLAADAPLCADLRSVERRPTDVPHRVLVHVRGRLVHGPAGFPPVRYLVGCTNSITLESRSNARTRPLPTPPGDGVSQVPYALHRQGFFVVTTVRPRVLPFVSTLSGVALPRTARGANTPRDAASMRYVLTGLVSSS
jgi:hypothetical protein